MSASLTVSGLCWQAGGRTLLDDIAFTLSGRGLFGVIGPNGAGKSSLLRCLYRFIEPTHGRLTLNGKPISDYSARQFAKLVAVVPQEWPAQFDLAVASVVAMGLIPHKGWLDGDTATDAERIAAALAQVGLAGFGERAFDKLSGGEKQRVMLARALAQQPQLLILDEPTSHLDVRFQIEMLELLKSLDICVLCSIHDLNLASALCDELLLLSHGRLVAKGPPEVVLTEARIAEVFGVCCQVSPHPQHGQPHIQYFYGYGKREGWHESAPR